MVLYTNNKKGLYKNNSKVLPCLVNLNISLFEGMIDNFHIKLIFGLILG